MKNNNLWTAGLRDMLFKEQYHYKMLDAIQATIDDCPSLLIYDVNAFIDELSHIVSAVPSMNITVAIICNSYRDFHKYRKIEGAIFINRTNRSLRGRVVSFYIVDSEATSQTISNAHENIRNNAALVEESNYFKVVHTAR